MMDASRTNWTPKRRGILAAAGAVVAALVAKQATQPVTAGTDGDVVLGAGNSTTTETIVRNTNATAGNATFQAIRSTTVLSAGLNLSHGIYALSDFTSGVGVAGIGGTGGIGVSGTATTGVLGQSSTAAGVEGQIPATSNAANTIGVFGNNLSTGANGIGVYGSSANGTGVYGQTAVSNQYGILGATNAVNSTAIAGACTGNGSSAFSGGTTNPAAYAGVFQGNVVIQGRLVVSDPSYKSGVLRHPDGSDRLVYCVESPESWIEDFGRGSLVGGKADVKFEADFATVVHTDDYHVFLTPRDAGSKGLAVIAQRAEGFTVQELQGGVSGGTFSWRVVAKPKSTVKQDRLGKFVMPTLPLPDVSKLPKPGPLPTIPTVPAKP